VIQLKVRDYSSDLLRCWQCAAQLPTGYCRRRNRLCPVQWSSAIRNKSFKGRRLVRRTPSREIEKDGSTSNRFRRWFGVIEPLRAFIDHLPQSKIPYEPSLMSLSYSSTPQGIFTSNTFLKVRCKTMVDQPPFTLLFYYFSRPFTSSGHN
jgi:hypothetical protein